MKVSFKQRDNLSEINLFRVFLIVVRMLLFSLTTLIPQSNEYLNVFGVKNQFSPL